MRGLKLLVQKNHKELERKAKEFLKRRIDSQQWKNDNLLESTQFHRIPGLSGEKLLLEVDCFRGPYIRDKLSSLC